MDPQQWMGAVRMRVKTADKNITSNPHHSRPSVNILRSKKLYVCNKHIHNRGILNLKHHFWPKYESIIHNNASSSEKVHPLLSSHIRIHICLEQFWTVVSCLICTYFSPASDEITFSLEKAILWIEDLRLKNVLMMDLFLTKTQLFISQFVNWWTGEVWITCGLLWCFYQLFEQNNNNLHFYKTMLLVCLTG